MIVQWKSIFTTIKYDLILCLFLMIFICWRNFQSFEATQNVEPNAANYGSYYDPNAYATPDPVYDPATSDFDNEPPLLEGTLHTLI